jgi:hypothetical protein
MNAVFPSLKPLRHSFLIAFAAGLVAAQPSLASEPERPGFRAEATSYSTALAEDGSYRVQAKFHSFDGDPLNLGFRLQPAASRQSVREFGVSVEELDALAQACKSARGCDQAEFDRYTTRYYREHALRLRTAEDRSTRLFVDVAQVVRRNRLHVQPVAGALRQLAAERGHGADWMVEAAVALVQTGLAYREPSMWDEGRKTMGFYPPPRALERGYGDCDTKAALLAAILQNLTETPLIGVHLPRHYLLGIAGVPRGDQAFVRHEGRPFVLVEVAGPSQRRPGDIARSTQAALDRREGLRIDPMF